MQRNALRRRFLIPAASLALLVALVPSLVAAQPHGPRGHGFGHRGPGMGPGPGFERLVERLELAPDQVEAIRAARQSHRAALHSAFEQVQAAQRALRQQIHTEDFDETAIRDAASALGSAEAEAAVQRARLSQEIREILTAEQQDELRALLEERLAFAEERAARFKDRFPDSDR